MDLLLAFRCPPIYLFVLFHHWLGRSRVENCDRMDQIVYQGRIDNLFAKIGKRRSRATQNDLRDALNSILKGIPIAVPKTTPIGCFLEKL